ncbi:biotin transporter BioY [Lactococcus garvieae]|uniref:Biotin transporter n=1 Tax=Lactococcus garvieae DCC43 TaxID=1231377 RepID=K2PJW3_9LACT|nr:biotin transporter BioY [Lactococcus garvieae]EKF50499.1 Substrate-specific component BioY of biotin ECF transporter [Lactococcus garvieae DCC43]
MKISQTYSITLIALGAAIVAVLSPLAIPVGIVPITLQTLAIGLIATLLQPRESFFALLTYLVLGAAGLPVFAGGASGMGALFGPTGGFLFSFILVAPLLSYFLLKTERKFISILLTNLGAQFLILVLGTIWLKFFIGASWGTAFSVGFLPFILGAIIKAVIIAGVAVTLLNILFKTNTYFSK